MPDSTTRDCSVSQAIAWACQDAGTAVATCVPGSGGTNVFELYRSNSESNYPYSFNEETAYAISHGAALAGTRSATFIKAHGLLKAANAVSDSLYAGTTAGFLTIVFTDADGSHSDSILDIKPFLIGLGIPWAQADIAHVYHQVLSLFTRSESTGLPYVLIVNTSDTSLVIPSPDRVRITQPAVHYGRNVRQHVLCPFFAGYQQQVLKARLEGNPAEGIKAPDIPILPMAVPDQWKPLILDYTPLFNAFRHIRGSLVTGDTGISSLFACEPFNSIDITTFMGGSIPLATGTILAGYHDAWAVTGDFAFVAAGHLGLLEARLRNLPLKLLLLCNGISATTGGQPVPQFTIDNLLFGYEHYMFTIHNPGDSAEVNDILERAKNSAYMAVVVVKY